jgi:hypothetical protein
MRKVSMRERWWAAREWLAGDQSWRGDLSRAVLIYLVTRVALGVFVWLVQQHEVCHGPRCTDNAVFPENRLLNGLFQWDAIHYYRVLSRGYFIGHDYDTTAPFFPGFPLAAKAVGMLVGSPLLGGILLNHVASLLAAVLMARLVRDLSIGEVRSEPGGAEALKSVDSTAREATLFWLGAPLTFFFAVFLSEALFGLASVTALWAVVRGRWPLALVAGIVVSATRNAGLIVCASALLLAWERRHVLPVRATGSVWLSCRSDWERSASIRSSPWVMASPGFMPSAPGAADWCSPGRRSGMTGLACPTSAAVTWTRCTGPRKCSRWR